MTWLMTNPEAALIRYWGLGTALGLIVGIGALFWRQGLRRFWGFMVVPQALWWLLYCVAFIWIAFMERGSMEPVLRLLGAFGFALLLFALVQVAWAFASRNDRFLIAQGYVAIFTIMFTGVCSVIFAGIAVAGS